MKSILLMGQSNMAGRGFVDEVPLICHERIQMLRSGIWQMMQEPIHYESPVAGIGPAGSFAALWCEANLHETLGCIPCAVGGSSAERWRPGDVLFQNAVFQAKIAMKSSELIAVLWHQGEADSFCGLYTVYEQRLREIIFALRKELNLPHLPILLGGLGDFLGKNALGKQCTEYQNINQILQALSSRLHNVYFVSAKGLTANTDGLHFDAVSQRRFGVRYYNAFAKSCHVLTPIDDEFVRITQTLKREHTKKEKEYLLWRDLAVGNIKYEEYAVRIQKFQNENTDTH